MFLKPSTIDIETMPVKILPYLENAVMFDSSCSKQAKTLYIKNDQGYFIKIAPKGDLHEEAIMTEYFHGKGLSARVCEYVSSDKDYLITEQILGQDGITQKYLDNPRKLCDVFSGSLRMLHEVNYTDCPRRDRTDAMYQDAEMIYKTGKYDDRLQELTGLKTSEEAYLLMRELMPLSTNDALLHGDYCLPNILLKEFEFSGFIDVGYGGVGDRHFDIFWGIWTLQYNLHTNNYKDRFLDGYGRDKIDMDRLKLNGILAALTLND